MYVFSVIGQCMCSLLLAKICIPSYWPMYVFPVLANVCVPCYWSVYVFPVIGQCMCSLLLANICIPSYWPIYVFPLIGQCMCSLLLANVCVPSDWPMYMYVFPVICQCMYSLLFANVCVPCYWPMNVFPVICQCMCSLLLANVYAPCYLSMYVFPVIWHIICVLTLICILYRSTNGSKLSTDSTSVTASDCSAVVFLEHVTVTIRFSYSKYRGATEFYLVSPSGAESHLLHFRYDDAIKFESGDTLTWTFMSVHFWWENPLGTWTLQFRSTYGNSTGKDTSIGLNIRFCTHIYFL